MPEPRIVSEEQLRSYVETYRNTLQKTAAERLSPEELRMLAPLSRFPARVDVYRSRWANIAIEYTPAIHDSVHVRSSDTRAEDALVGNTHLQGSPSDPPLFYIVGSNSISDVFLNARRPVVVLPGDPPIVKPLVLEHVLVPTPPYGRRIAYTKHIRYAEIYTDRTPERWTDARAVGDAKDIVLAALVDSRRARGAHLSLTDYIATLKRRTVLLLGAYDPPGKARLDRIRACLVRLGYEVKMVSDEPDNLFQDLRQKVTLFGNLARFVVVDDTAPSGHLIEIEIAHHQGWVTAVLREPGKRSSFMAASLPLHSTVMNEFDLSGAADCGDVAVACRWSEHTLRELKRGYQDLYPWRSAGHATAP